MVAAILNNTDNTNSQACAQAIKKQKKQQTTKPKNQQKIKLRGFADPTR